MANETTNKDSLKKEGGTQDRPTKLVSLYNRAVQLLPYIVLLVGAVVGGRVWWYYLSYAGRCTELDELLKEAIESSLFANITLMVGLLYVVIMLFIHVCQSKPRWWRVPAYSIIATYIYVIPQWVALNTAIPGLDYPILIIAGLVVIGIYELRRLVYRHCTKEAYKELPNGADGFIVKAYTDTDEMVATGWEDFINTIFSMVGKKQLIKESFAIGIAGSWGSGKTTFYEAMKQKIKQDKMFVLCEFKPWQILEPARIAPDFFAEFIKAIKWKEPNREPRLYKSIAKYAQMLTEVPQLSGWTQFVNICFGSGPKGSVKELREEIDNLLENLETSVAVMIDDLDRLNKDELLEIMRLVRASANFKHVLFILVYDKEHFAKELGNKDGSEYLKKIVNVEINLPLIENYKYRDLMLKNIRKIVPDLENTSQLKELDKACKVYNKAQDNILLTIYSHNFRDLLRFSNHFGLILRHLLVQGRLEYFNIRDLFWLEMLHYYEEDVYNQLQSPQWTLLKTVEDPLTKQQYLTLRENKENEKKALPVDDVLNELFNPSKREHANSIVWRNNFNNYFAHRLLDNAVSIHEFANLIEQAKWSKDVRKQVKTWCKGHARISFLNVIKNYPHNNAFVSEQAFKNYIRVLFVLLKTKELKEFDVAELKNILYMKCRSSYFEKIETDRIMVFLRKLIIKRPAIEWNHLLTAMCPMTKKDFVDKENSKKIAYLLNCQDLRELAILNYTCKFKKRNLPVDELFNPNNEYTKFIASLSYMRMVSVEKNSTFEAYDNLVGEYVLKQLDRRGRRYKLREEIFMDIYTNLLLLADINEQMDKETLTRAVRKAIEQTLGSVEGFESFLQKHCYLGESGVQLCKDIGLNVKPLDVDD